MRVLIDVGHPKEVNIFRNVIKELERRGHTVKIVARDKENTAALLDAYGFNYKLGRYYNGLINKVIGALKNDFLLYKISKKFEPDIFVGSPYTAQISKLFRKPHIGLADTEIASLAIRLMMPFTNAICVPSCFSRDLGSKEVKFNGYFELAYLHPNYFKPDSSILEKLNLSKDDKYILLRFSSLGAHHDIGAKGFDFKSSKEMHEFIKKIKNYGHIFLTSEIKLDSELEKYKAHVPLKDFHDLISFATLYIGEGASMAAEAAILGVPSIYISTTRRGYLDELEEKYGLVYTFNDREQAQKKAVELLEDTNLKEKWQKKREKMLSEKIDTAKFMVDFIENYSTTNSKEIGY
jgi:predicted glycosyltransferase